MRQYEECLVVTLSSKLSGSYNAARNAMEIVREEYPEKRIYIFDSKALPQASCVLRCISKS